LKLSSLDRRSVINKDGQPLSLRTSCQHADDDYELRRHVIASGVIHYKFECQVCGRRGSAIPKNDPIRTGLTSDPPYTDPDLQARYWKEVEEANARARQERQEDWWEQYNQYLESPEWRSKRDLVLARDNNRCQARMDGCTRVADHVHHLTYNHLFNEPLFELVAVCRSCHNRLHGRQVTIMGRAA
jgi:5-methylcytosine-specific restriction endonuclease McrA